MKSALLAGVLAMVSLMDSTHAATSTCPPIQDIKQTEMANGGYRYEASYPDARYDATDQSVTCTYKGPMNNDASFSVTLKPVFHWNLLPIGDWKGTYCEAMEVAKCSFTHR